MEDLFQIPYRAAEAEAEPEFEAIDPKNASECIDELIANPDWHGNTLAG